MSEIVKSSASGITVVVVSQGAGAKKYSNVPQGTTLGQLLNERGISYDRLDPFKGREGGTDKADYGDTLVDGAYYILSPRPKAG